MVLYALWGVYGRRKSFTSFTPLWEVFIASNDREAVDSDWNSIEEEALLSTV